MHEDPIPIIKHFLVSDLFVEIPEDQIGLDDGLQSMVGLDSVGFIELRVLCENRFHIQIADTDFTPDNFRSVRCVAHLVEQLQSQQLPTQVS
jgi:acyl carrier protein